MTESEEIPALQSAEWLSGEHAEPARAAWHRLAESIRKINETLVGLDAPEAELAAATERADAYLAELEALRAAARIPAAGTSRSTIIDRSPILGLANAVSPPVRVAVEGERVIGLATFGLQHEGPPGHVHGGIVSGAFDEVLGVAQKLTGRPGLTGTLTVRYRKPTPLYRELRFEAWVSRLEGRKMTISGTLVDGETLCADADGIFILVGPEAFEKMRAAGGSNR